MFIIVIDYDLYPDYEVIHSLVEMFFNKTLERNIPSIIYKTEMVFGIFLSRRKTISWCQNHTISDLLSELVQAVGVRSAAEI